MTIDLKEWKIVAGQMGLSEEGAVILKTVEEMFKAAIPDETCLAVDAVGEMSEGWITEHPAVARTGLHGSVALDNAQIGVPGQLRIVVVSSNEDDLNYFGDRDAGTLLLLKSAVPDDLDGEREVYMTSGLFGLELTPEEGTTWGDVVRTLNTWAVENLSTHQPIATLTDPDAADIVYNSYGLSIPLLENGIASHCSIKSPE